MNIFKNNNSNRKTDLIPLYLYIGVLICLSFIVLFIQVLIKDNQDIIDILQLSPFIILFLALFIRYILIIILDIKHFTKKDLLWTIIISILSIAINYGLTTLFEYLNIEMNNQNELVRLFNNHKIYTSIITIFIAPIVEEIVFRYSIDTVFRNNILFLVISSFIFALMHGFGIVSIIYIIMGLCYGYLYLKTNRNIISPILAHMLNNLISIITIILSI